VFPVARIILEESLTTVPLSPFLFPGPKCSFSPAHSSQYVHSGNSFSRKTDLQALLFPPPFL